MFDPGSQTGTIFVAIYAAPTILAWVTGHPRAIAITGWSLLLGWTLVGWIVGWMILSRIATLLWALALIWIPVLGWIVLFVALSVAGGRDPR